jgi:hypothetical protein
MWYARAMILHLVRVVALLVAACLAPSLAYAHAGHTHHADHALAPADIAAPVTAGHQDQIAATVIVKTAVASAPSSADRVGCVGHCCSGVAGMPCCGAVLVPEISAAPDMSVSHLVRFARAIALLGLPPEALPKPPKFLG